MSNIPSINPSATGANIKLIMKAKGITTSELQSRLGFNTPQSIFKWLRGDMMPSLDNLVILAYILNTPIDNIIITN